jgi:hypothetical protein
MNLAAQPDRVKTQCAPCAQKTHRVAVDMFAVNRLIRRSDLSYAAQTLLCAILEHDRYGQSERGCVASLDTLAAEIGAKPRYVTKLLPKLLEGRWVTEERDGKHRPLRLGPRCRDTMNPVQSDLGAECTQEQSCFAPRNDCSCTSVQMDPVSILEVREETEFAGGLAAPGKEDGPRLTLFDPSEPAPLRPAPRGFPNPPRPKPVQPTMQNCNPPAPPVPDDDPATTAATLARGWRAWAAEGGAK